jgi:hypothetical protein
LRFEQRRRKQTSTARHAVDAACAVRQAWSGLTEVERGVLISFGDYQAKECKMLHRKSTQQIALHFLGKEEVTSLIPVNGSQPSPSLWQ